MNVVIMSVGFSVMRSLVDQFEPGSYFSLISRCREVSDGWNKLLQRFDLIFILRGYIKSRKLYLSLCELEFWIVDNNNIFSQEHAKSHPWPVIFPIFVPYGREIKHFVLRGTSLIIDKHSEKRHLCVCKQCKCNEIYKKNALTLEDFRLTPITRLLSLAIVFLQFLLLTKSNVVMIVDGKPVWKFLS